MKTAIRTAALAASLLLLAPAALAQEAEPGKDNAIRVNTITPNYLRHLAEERQKQEDAKKARDEKAALNKEKMEKIDKVERKTGTKAKSWQVLNR